MSLPTPLPNLALAALWLATASGLSDVDALPSDTIADGPGPSVAGRVRPSIEDPKHFSFVVLGHVRGDRSGELHYLMDDLLTKVRARDPDFAVLTGDMIWGEVDRPHRDPDEIRREWRALDDTLATLGIPIYRVPGNHDVSDLVTRDVWIERYDTLPRVIDVGDTRLLLMNSSWFPEDGDRRMGIFGRGRDMSPEELAFIERHLAGDGSYDHAFLFMHHLLWWDDFDGRWWEEVHPLLERGGVDAVFTGDYGPMKFSHRRADGIDYYQSGISPDPELALLRSHEWDRLLAQQFDNFLDVTVDGSEARVEVVTVGATASGHFTPEHWHDITGAYSRWEHVGYPGFRHHAREAWNHPRGRWAILGLGLFLLAAGFGAGLLFRRVRRGTSG